MRPVVWRPPAEPWPAEQAVIKAVRRARLFVLLRLQRKAPGRPPGDYLTGALVDRVITLVPASKTG